MAISEKIRSVLRRRVVHEGGWIAVGRISTAIALLVGTRWLTEYISPPDYGSLSLLINIAVLGTGVSCGPIYQAILRYYDKDDVRGDMGSFLFIINKLLYRSIAFGIIIWLCIGFILVLTKGLSIFLVIGISLFFYIDAIKYRDIWILNVSRRQFEFGLWNGVESWAKLFVAIIFIILFGPFIESVIIGYVIGTFLVMAIFKNFIAINAGINLKKKVSECEEIKIKIEGYALPLVPITLFSWVSGVSDRYLLGGIVGLKQVGLYVVGYAISSAPFLLIGGILDGTLRPIYYSSVSSGDRNKEHKTFLLWSFSAIIICGIGVLIIYFTKESITKILLAKEYYSSAELMPWIALGYLFFIISEIYMLPCFAYEKTRYIFIIRLIGAIACIVITLPFVYYFRLIGAAIAVPMYFGIQLLASVYLSRKIIKYPFYDNICNMVSRSLRC